MAANRPARKTAFRAALDSYANPQNRDDILRLCHAVFSTAMVKSAVEKTDDKSAVKKAAKAECFAECIEMIEEEIGEAHSAFIKTKQTILTTPAGMPNGSPTGVVRASESRQSTSTTPQT